MNIEKVEERIKKADKDLNLEIEKRKKEFENEEKLFFQGLCIQIRQLKY